MPSYPTIKPHWVSKATDICTDIKDEVYIIRSDLKCYMVTSDLHKGTNIAVHDLHPACQGGDHYFANRDGFYIIKDDSVRFVKNLTTDEDASVFSLHPSCRRGTHYASGVTTQLSRPWFVIIWAGQGKATKVSDLSSNAVVNNFSLDNNCKGGLYYWVTKNSLSFPDFNFLRPAGQWGVTYHITDDLQNDKGGKDLSVHPDVIPFLPGGLALAKGTSYGRWELLKSFQNTANTTINWKQMITHTVGYKKSQLQSIERNWNVKTTAGIEAAITMLQLSTEASYGGNTTHTSEQQWTNSTEVQENISCEIKAWETVYIWQYQVGFGSTPVLFARSIQATFSPDPPADNPFNTDQE